MAKNQRKRNNTKPTQSQEAKSQAAAEQAPEEQVETADAEENQTVANESPEENQTDADETSDDSNHVEEKIDASAEETSTPQGNDITDESKQGDTPASEDEKTVADVYEEDQELPLEERTLDPMRDGNYLNQPKEIRDAEVSQEHVHMPTNTRRTPPMNPFMKIANDRAAAAVKSKVATPAEMAEKIKGKYGDAAATHFNTAVIVGKLNNYVSAMAPNTPMSDELGASWQGELAKCFFEALQVAPEASVLSLGVLELYFTEYRNHAFSRTHVFRFMDKVRLEKQELMAFQSLLHLFLELGADNDKTKKEIQREISISKIADSINNNTDAQVRLAEFLNQ